MGTTWNGPEHRPTQAERRRDRFNEAGALAKAIADVALEDIDLVLTTNAQLLEPTTPETLE